MRVTQVDPKSPQLEVVQQACEVLRRGGLVAFPTDTLYALGANALDPAAIERVLTVKGRHHGKPLSVLVPSVEAGAALAASLPDGAQALMRAFWPGALTVVVRASAKIPSVLTAATGTVGLRMPAGAVAQALLAATLPAAPVAVGLLGAGVTGAITVQMTVNPIERWYNGALIFTPGTNLSIQTGVASGASGTFCEYIWEEVAA